MLKVEHLGAWLAEAEYGGERPFLLKPLWPSDAYGVLGAQDKAGKTWSAVDMAISVANGVPWLGEFPVKRQGSVVYYCGEGGHRNLARRFDAVARSKDLGPWLVDGDRGWADDIRISDAVPQLTAQKALEDVSADLAAHPDTVLVVIDPLYLASAGLKGSDLYEMGRAFQGIQMITQDAGAALVVLTHWNKTGEGDGASRFTGVGPGAWGRVLGSAAIVSAEREGSASLVTLKWTFTGSEIPETVFWMQRRVEADDPDDLDSPLQYAIETFEVDPIAEAKKEAKAEARQDQRDAETEIRRVERKRDIWRSMNGDWMSTRAIVDAVGGRKADTPGLLLELVADQYIEVREEEHGSRTDRFWKRLPQQ